MLTNKLNAEWLRCVLVLVCASLVVAGCSHGSLTDGARYQAEGKYRAASIEAKKVLQDDAYNGEAWLLLGKATLMQGNAKAALTDLEKARANKVPAERWAVPMGRAMLAMHQYDKLLTTLPDGKALKPATQVDLLVIRGDAYRGSNQPRRARKSYAAALKLDPTNARALVGLSMLAAVGGDMAAARKYVRQALAAAPESQDAWVAKGSMAFVDGDFTGAQEAYQKALDIKSPGWMPQDRFVARLKLAEVQARQRQYDKAVANLDALEKMAPQMPQPHYLHAVVLFQQGQLDEAVTQLQQVLKVAPGNVAAQSLMGQVNYARGNYGQAQMYLSNVMGMDPTHEQARKLLALSFYREGSSSRALTTLKPVLPGQTTNTEMLALLQRAVASGAAMSPAQRLAASGSAGLPTSAGSAGGPLARQFAGVRKALADGDTDKAIDELKAMPEGEGAAAAQRAGLLVTAYARDKHAGEGVKVAAAWAARHPTDPAAHLLYGTALVADGKRDKARAEYEQAAKLDPKGSAAVLNLASLDVLDGHYKDAKGRFEEILKQHPRNVVAMLSLGRLAMARRDHAGAIQWFKQAITTAPTAAEPYLRLITLYSRGARFDDAVATAHKLVNANPGDPLALNALGATELSAGHPDKALKPLEQAVQRAPAVALYRINLARAQILLKNTKAARTNLEQVVKAHPDQAQAVRMLAFMKFRAGDLPGALTLARTLQKPAATKLAGFTLEGDLYMAAKAWRKAAGTYEHALQARYTRELVLKHFQALNAGGADNAEHGLIQWLGKHGNDAAMRMVLAQYYLNHGRQQLAAQAYRKVLKAYPTNVIALNNLAWVYVVRHNPNAVTVAEKAYKLAPTAANAADTYASALLGVDKPKAALPVLEKAARQAPEDPIIHYHLAQAQARTGDHVAARATLAALIKSKARYPQQKSAAALYQKLGGTTEGK